MMDTASTVETCVFACSTKAVDMGHLSSGSVQYPRRIYRRPMLSVHPELRFYAQISSPQVPVHAAKGQIAKGTASTGGVGGTRYLLGGALAVSASAVVPPQTLTLTAAHAAIYIGCTCTAPAGPCCCPRVPATSPAGCTATRHLLAAALQAFATRHLPLNSAAVTGPWFGLQQSFVALSPSSPLLQLPSQIFASPRPRSAVRPSPASCRCFSSSPIPSVAAATAPVAAQFRRRVWAWLCAKAVR